MMSHERAKTTVLLWSVILVVAFVCPATIGAPAEKSSRLTKYISHLCKKSDPKLNKCLLENVNDVLKYAKTGIPELGIPIIEPYAIQEIDLRIFHDLGISLFGGSLQRSDGKHKAFARNLVVHHSSEFTINDFKADMGKKEFIVDLSFPLLQVEGEYDVNLVVFNIPIKSTGPVLVNSTDTNVKATLTGKTIKMKNNSYMLFDSIDIKVNFKDYTIMIDKLFKKDQNLNRALNDIMRSQKAELRKLAMPMIEELAGKMVLEMINKILSGLPLEELFLPE